MKISRQLSLTFVLLCSIALLFSNVFIVKCDPDTAVVGHDCSEDTYDPNGGYGAEIDQSLDDMTYNTCNQPNFQYTLTGTYTVGDAYCNVSLTQTDCILCLEVADDFLRENCQDSISASVTLVDCGMSYAPINNNGPSVA